ncbi:winged helix-turn-helix transcriptional regulator [Roseibium marinum]|uniref:DNA-binding HxlR family transcriptional regulator n=1 Tax=Roseibium marinum TaxID=281252 RepID=A0A2S3UVL0_9HYPH|nr:helix-turn-helix domain-containing protein [Roseibium marinum]POF31726.1 DNA-binding HxlR family transcriptional regulator [Roseibium marinum]
MTGRNARECGHRGQDETTLSSLLRRGELFSTDCPSREILKHLTSRWGVLVLIALLEEDHRFSDLRRKIGGVSEKMLSQTLQTLEADGFVNRFSHPVVPPHVDYSLTPIGREAALKVREFADWIEINIGRILTGESPAEA